MCFNVDSSGRWKKIAKVGGDKTSYKATGLKEGETYQFRVRSANEEGESDAVESKPVTPMKEEEPPYIAPEVSSSFELVQQFTRVFSELNNFFFTSYFQNCKV